MLTSLRLRNFKNFADETLRMGPFTIIVGANASGKSNIRDALRFLHGVGRGYTLADILGGKYGAGGQAEWGQIRGAPAEVVRQGQEQFALAVDLPLTESHSYLRTMPPMKCNVATYAVLVKPNDKQGGAFRVAQEELHAWLSHIADEQRVKRGCSTNLGCEIFEGSKSSVYTSSLPAPDSVRNQDDEHHLLLRMEKVVGRKKPGYRIAVRPDQPALTQIGDHKQVHKAQKDLARHVANHLGSMRFLDPSPAPMRRPSFPGQTMLGDRGENLPTVLQAICDDSRRRNTLLEWTRELTPMDVADFEFRKETSGRIQLVIKENDGRAISSESASDGTLRFLAILAALLSEPRPRLYMFEELENGIHPSRLHLLLELIESETDGGDVQVVATTHSPALLNVVSDKTFENTAVVCRCPERDNAVIRSVCSLPNATELRGSQGLGRLHTGGWLENAVYFSDPDEDVAQ